MEDNACERAFVSYSPGMQFGCPCVGHSRLPAFQVAEAVAGGNEQEYLGDGYGLTKREVLVCCAWVVDTGPPSLMKKAARRKWKDMAIAWTQWRDDVYEDLWRSNSDLSETPFPPQVD